MSEMGFNVLLRSNNSYRLMSALGQKRTFSPYSITLSALARRLGGMVSPSVLQFSPKSVQPMNFLCLTFVSDLPTSMTLIGKS